jgi:hypothetical protein
MEGAIHEKEPQIRTDSISSTWEIKMSCIKYRSILFIKRKFPQVNLSAYMQEKSTDYVQQL